MAKKEKLIKNNGNKKEKFSNTNDNKTEENTDLIRQAGRIIAGGFYDMQELRISTLNRIRDVIRKKKMGIPFDAVEEKKEEQEREKQESFTDDELMIFLEEEMKSGNLTEKEYKYMERCMTIFHETKKIEAKYKLAMEDYIVLEPIYQEFLCKIKGIGPVLSCNLLKEFSYSERYETVSKLWAHSGNSVVNGIAEKKKKGEELHFSPRLRTLTWKISDCLLKHNKGFYREVYDNDKEKQLAKQYPLGALQQLYGKNKEGKGIYQENDVHIKKGHAHNRALRQMRKLFLSHYWSCGRELKKLPTRLLYVQEKLGHTSIVTWQDAVKKEGKYQPKKVAEE